MQPYLRFCDGPRYFVLQTRYCYTRFERKRMTDSQGEYRLYGVLGQVPLVPDATCVWNAKGHKCVSFQGSPSLRSIKACLSGTRQRTNGKAGLGRTLQRKPGLSPDVMRPVVPWKLSRMRMRLSEIGIPHSLRSFSKQRGPGDSANFA